MILKSFRNWAVMKMAVLFLNEREITRESIPQDSGISSGRIQIKNPTSQWGIYTRKGIG